MTSTSTVTTTVEESTHMSESIRTISVTNEITDAVFTPDHTRTSKYTDKSSDMMTKITQGRVAAHSLNSQPAAFSRGAKYLHISLAISVLLVFV
jgi:hypothetical protein